MRHLGALLLLSAVDLAGCYTPVPVDDPYGVFKKASQEGAGGAGEAIRVFSSDVDSPRYQLPENADNFAVVVGIEDYSTLPAAQFAERDAAAVRAHLRALGYPERNIAYATGKSAGLASIEKYVETWLPRNVTASSTVVFYFSGHGAPAAENGQAYLVPWDGDPQFLTTTGYPIQKLYAKLNALSAKNIVVAMDSCFSGAGGRSVIAKGTRPLVTKIDLGVAGADKLVVLAASAGDEITGADQTQGHGLFTYYLLKALDERNGAATAKELYDRLAPKVEDAARRENRDQTPQLLAADPARRAAARLADPR